MKQTARKPKKKRREKRRRPCQAHAYHKWDAAKVEEWWCSLRKSPEPPIKEQELFLKCVEERCLQEERDLRRLALEQNASIHGDKRRKCCRHTTLTEPLLACLFGIPGSGKSTCIRLLRSFFMDAVGWEEGVDFQFLASQNTMAALIGGKTVHHWGSTPVNARTARDESMGKVGDGDVDELFERVLGCRWLVIDESSTYSLTLLGLLDSYLRRACTRQPFAGSGRDRRPFGGLNVIFAGDLWQLPPVKGRAIFSDPFHGGLSAEEQNIAKIFWKVEAPIQQLFLLTHGHRTKDPWLKSVLEADRDGEESWEMYCFTHGLPTRNPGSWLPDLGGPACGNAHCQSWATRWQEVRASGENATWAMRLHDACPACTTERQRRNRIITTNRRNMDLYTKDPFTDAPFVHPFRAPSYHAQHLRSVHFARARQQHLLWIVAHDKLLNHDRPVRPGQTETRRERWLEYHERFTNGIPGLLPLVLDLPVRFTDSPNPEAKEFSIYKYTRGF